MAGRCRSLGSRLSARRRRIRELAAIPDGEWSYEPARDTLWILTGEGSKPSWYDDWAARRLTLTPPGVP